MSNVRIGVIGLGSMGNFHIGYLHEIEGAILTAVCDADAERVKKAAEGLVDIRAKADSRVADPQAVGRFTTYQALLDSKLVDAIIIATPHFQHPEIAIAAFERGIHVLSEKPLAVHVKDARKVIETHKKHPDLKFALMLQMRTVPIYKKIKALIAEGELGEVSRITWLVTDWFRTWSYYASGGWRATWAGEGGGVLINQCPHNLDLLHWLTGMMPSRITAVASLGKTHPIEVEDEVSAILEYSNGAIGHFVTTTGEAPGTNRLEICGDRGKLIAEGGKLAFHRTRKGVREIRETSPEAFVNVETWQSDIPLTPGSLADGHRIIMQNFIRGILKNEPLLSGGEDGDKGLEIGNAMLMAGITKKPVELPLDGDAYEQLLKDLHKQYGGKKKLETREVKSDMSTSFQRVNNGLAMSNEPAENSVAHIDPASLNGHAVIAGFGVPGRSVADLIHSKGMSFCVIEQNLSTIERCRKTGLCMVEGDASDVDALRRAGLDRAVLFACTVPNDDAMYAAVAAARKMNSKLRIIARCRYVSSGFEATRRGADDVVIEEQTVAQAFAALLAKETQN